MTERDEIPRPPKAHIEWEWQRHDRGVWWGITTHDDYAEAIRQPFDSSCPGLRLIRRTITEVVLP
jgi:hypothetical protein